MGKFVDVKMSNKVEPLTKLYYAGEKSGVETQWSRVIGDKDT